MNTIEPAPAGEEWLTELQLRQRLRYSRSTIRSLRKAGLPHIGADRLRRYPWNEVREWLAARVVRPQSLGSAR